MTSPTDKPMKGPERISKDYCADGEDASWRYPDLKYLEPVTTVEYIRADLVAKIHGTDEAWDSGVLGQSAEHASTTPQSVVEPTAGGMEIVLEALDQAFNDFCDIPDSKDVETPRRLKEAIAIAQSFAERERELQQLAIVPGYEDCSGNEILEIIEGLEQERDRYRTALEKIAGFGDVNLSGEWEHSLRSIIRSVTDCAKEALHAHQTQAAINDDESKGEG